MKPRRSLPDGWAWADFDEVATIRSNLVDPKTCPDAAHIAPNHIESGSARLLSYATVSDDGVTSNKHRFHPGQILYSKIRPYLAKVVLVDFGGVCSADMYPVEPRIEPRYLLRWLVSPEFTEFASRSQGRTVLPKINQNALNRTSVPVPPLREQWRIADKMEALLGSSRRAKEALDAIPPLLERFRQSVLAAAFRGDLTADWRAQNPDVEPIAKVVSRVDVKPPRGGRSATIAVRPGLSALSVGLPEDRRVPPGWQWVPLSSVARLESGHTPSRRHPEYWDGPIRWVGIVDARDSHGRRLMNTYQTITKAGLDNSSARLLPANTVCLVRTAASIGYVTILGSEMATSQDLVNWVCSEAIVPEYLMYLLIAEKESILSFGKGSAHRTVYYPEVKAFHVCLPPVAEQREIVRHVEEKLAALERLSRAFAYAQRTRDHLEPSILAKAFRGELVPQDPDDEPASVLLERIRAVTKPTTSRGKKRSSSRSHKATWSS